MSAAKLTACELSHLYAGIVSGNLANITDRLAEIDIACLTPEARYLLGGKINALIPRLEAARQQLESAQARYEKSKPQPNP